MKKWRTTGSKILVQDRWIKLRADSCITPAGDVLEPYYVLEYTDVILCLAITSDYEVITLNHYRHGINDFVPTEIIGGIIEPSDDSPNACARRELAEETGYIGGKIYPTGTAYMNPSNHTNRFHAFLVVGGDCKAKPQAQAGETFEMKKVPIKNFIREIEQPAPGVVYQGLHLAGIFMGLNFIKHSTEPELEELKQLLRT